MMKKTTKTSLANNKKQPLGAPDIPVVHRKYRAIRYTQVEQNEQGYWIIISSEQTNVYYEVYDVQTLTEKEVLSFLKNEKVIDTADMRKVNATLGVDLIEVHEKKSLKPLCRLQKVIN